MVNRITFAGMKFELSEELDRYLETYDITYLYLTRVVEYRRGHSSNPIKDKLKTIRLYNFDSGFIWEDTPEGRKFWDNHEEKFDAFSRILRSMKQGGD